MLNYISLEFKRLIIWHNLETCVCRETMTKRNYMGWFCSGRLVNFKEMRHKELPKEDNQFACNENCIRWIRMLSNLITKLLLFINFESLVFIILSIEYWYKNVKGDHLTTYGLISNSNYWNRFAFTKWVLLKRSRVSPLVTAYIVPNSVLR